jgi:hypothetical protein
MTAFGTSRLTTESTDGSIGTSPTRFRAWDLGADTLVRRFATRGTRLEPDLRDATKRNDRQMHASAVALDDQFELGSRPSAHERMRLGARRPPRPSPPRLEAWSPAGRESPEVDLVGRARAKARVRALGVVPGRVGVELAPEGDTDERHDRQEASAFVLHRPDEPLDDGDASVLADGAQAVGDAVTPEPGDELIGGVASFL